MAWGTQGTVYKHMYMYVGTVSSSEILAHAQCAVFMYNLLGLEFTETVLLTRICVYIYMYIMCVHVHQRLSTSKDRSVVVGNKSIKKVPTCTCTYTTDRIQLNTRPHLTCMCITSAHDVRKCTCVLAIVPCT